MRKTSLCLILIFCSGSLTLAQATQPGSPQRETVHFQEANATPPTLIPPQATFTPPKDCEKRFKNKVRLAFLVDSNGFAHDVLFETFSGNELDYLAAKFVEGDRFIPASLNGEKIAVGRTVEMQMEACMVSEVDQAGKKTVGLKLKSWPEQHFDDAPPPAEPVMLEPSSQTILDPCQDQSDPACKPLKIGGKVLAPKPILHPSPEFPQNAIEKRIEAACGFTLTVDVHGLPRDIQFTTHSDPEFDKAAYDAVRGYRFIPAKGDGHPVPVRIGLEVRFKSR
jgi:hypothetical protein